MDQDQHTRLQSIFREVFELPAGSDVTGLEAGVTEAWDSVAHVSLIAAIESEFGITIDTAESLDMTSWERAADLVARETG